MERPSATFVLRQYWLLDIVCVAVKVFVRITAEKKCVGQNCLLLLIGFVYSMEWTQAKFKLELWSICPTAPGSQPLSGSPTLAFTLLSWSLYVHICSLYVYMYNCVIIPKIKPYRFYAEFPEYESPVQSIHMAPASFPNRVLQTFNVLENNL